jgi:16S rRNA (adenine1518-N6/adenine1519-N6)-dimethyltransferase
MTHAKKRFGQNFMVDPHKANSLVESLNIIPGETILEIGPGTGILTERILQANANLIAVELDRDMIDPLQERFTPTGRFRLIESDIIKIDPHTLVADKLKVIGNLPYNISGAMIEWFIAHHESVKLAVITVQKEVAARLRAIPGNRDYGALSVMIQSYFDIKRLFDIPPGCFSPKPKVLSTALSLTPHKKIADDIDFPRFREFLWACFSKKRKTLINSLSFWSEGETFSKEQVEKYLASLSKKPDIRAEQLSLSDFLELFRLARE